MRSTSRRVSVARVGVAAITALALAVTPLIATTATAAPGTGQTSTISGVVKKVDGTLVAGVNVEYDNLVCGSLDDIDGASDDSDTITTTAAGTFSFPAYAGQCYSLGTPAGVVVGSSVSETLIIRAGTTNVTVTPVEPIDLNLTIAGVGVGTPVILYASFDMFGVRGWAPVSSGTTDATSKVVLNPFRGTRYTLRIGQSGDYYTQYVGSGIKSPGLNGGPGNFIAPKAGASFNQSVSVRKSSPLQVSLSGVEAGATVSAIGFDSLAGLSSISGTTVTANSITLRGLTPGNNLISVSGVNGADDVSAEQHNVVIADNTNAPKSISLNASVRGDALTSTSNLIVTSTGSLQIGKKLTASTTFTGPAAPFAAAPGTSIKYYWYGSRGLYSFDSLDLLAEGPQFTLTPALNSYNMLLTIAVVSAPGQQSGMGIGYGWVNPAMLTLIGGFPFPVSTELIAGESPFPQTLPAVSGQARVGSVLRAAPGRWSQSPSSFKYQWNRAGKAIPGATAATYRPGTADVGKQLSVTVTPVKAGHLVVPMTSAPTAKVAKATAKVTAKAKKKIKAGKRAKVTVTVKAPGVTPTGKVTVAFGKKKVTKKLNKKGKATIKSSKLKRGKYKVAVNYKGSAAVNKAKVSKKKAKKLTITVR